MAFGKSTDQLIKHDRPGYVYFKSIREVKKDSRIDLYDNA